jgi:uncharacterized protein (DUF2249 family)
MSKKAKKPTVLDVREDIQRGREPFSRIMLAVSALGPNEDLLLLAPFEPKPLVGILAQQGFRAEPRETPSGDWEILFTRRPLSGESGSDSAPAARANPARPTCSSTPVVRVDARGLMPPEPLVKILESAAQLPQGAVLQAHTDRRPMHLLDELAARGFQAEALEQSDGSFITHVRRS